MLVDITGRSDVSVVDIPDEMKGMMKASTLREVERETGTFCFFQGDTSTSNALLICGYREHDRNSAVSILQDLLVRGAMRPRARRRPEGGQRQDTWAPSGRGAPGPAGRPQRDVPSGSESDSLSETGSESDYFTQSAEDARPQTVQPPRGDSRGGYGSRRRQWASEESNSASDDEIVPYW